MRSDPREQLARRVCRIEESATMRVTRRAAELEAAGVPVIPFGAGEPDFDSPAVAVDAACSALRQGFTKYTPLAGTADLRDALAARYRQQGAPWLGSQVLITVGAKAALLELALALFDDGDEVVVPSPCWVTFPEQIRLCDAEPVLVPCRAEDGFAIRAEPLLAAVTDATRAVVLNSPCNPTGGVISASELRELVTGCASRGVIVVSDETYERFVYAGEHASVAPLAAEFPDTVALVGSFSKTYAMTGWRVGFLCGPRWLVDAAARVQSHATSNVTSFAMVGALAALRSAEPDVRRMLEEYRARRDLVLARLAAVPGVECLPPAGAFYAFPRVSAHFGPDCPDSSALAERLLDETRVAVVPGAAFGCGDHIRLSFACSRAELEEGLERIRQWLAR